MQELLNVIGGLITLSLFGGTLWQLWRHTRPDGPLKRGLVMLLAGPLFFLFIGPLLSHLMLVPRIRKRLITLASPAD